MDASLPSRAGCLLRLSFPAWIISCAVRWYHRFNLRQRDVGELLLERGVTVTHETVRIWCERFGAQFARCAKIVRGKPGSAWHRDKGS
jgi:putative transposase